MSDKQTSQLLAFTLSRGHQLSRGAMTTESTRRRLAIHLGKIAEKSAAVVTSVITKSRRGGIVTSERRSPINPFYDINFHRVRVITRKEHGRTFYANNDINAPPTLSSASCRCNTVTIVTIRLFFFFFFFLSHAALDRTVRVRFHRSREDSGEKRSVLHTRVVSG
jgi:hypothetical protein